MPGQRFRKVGLKKRNVGHGTTSDSTSSSKASKPSIIKPQMEARKLIKGRRTHSSLLFEPAIKSPQRAMSEP
eukprot:4462682-Prymnesium_polylepis.1